MNAPLISIITVVYNSRPYIESTLQSIACQSCKDFEYIIIDGKSTDGTLDIIEQYRYLVDVLVSEPDKGLYDAMNKGLHQAQGRYVWFINSGDRIYAEDTVEQIASLFGEHPDAEVFYGQTELINQYGNSLGMIWKTAPKRLTAYSLLMGMVVCHQSFIVKRSLAPKYDLSYRITADYLWMLSILKKTRRNIYTHQILSQFLHEGFAIRNRHQAHVERFQIMRKQYGLLLTILAHGVIAIKFPFKKKT
jgi:glycosyltransferase involved in cell wall biosynthesis